MRRRCCPTCCDLEASKDRKRASRIVPSMLAAQWPADDRRRSYADLMGEDVGGGSETDRGDLPPVPGAEAERSNVDRRSRAPIERCSVGHIIAIPWQAHGAAKLGRQPRGDMNGRQESSASVSEAETQITSLGFERT